MRVPTRRLAARLRTIAMDGVGISPLHEIDLLRMHQKIRRAITEAGGTGTFSGVAENCVTPPI